MFDYEVDLVLMEVRRIMDTNLTGFMVNDQGLNTNLHHSSPDVTEAITLTVLFFLSLVGNGLVCYCGLTSTRTQAMNHLIVNLAFAEMLLAILVLPVHIQKQFTGRFETINTNLCRLLQYFQTVALGAVNISLSMIALDRYFSIFTPQSKITLRKVKYMIVLSWSIPLLVTSPIFVDLSGSSGQTRQLLLRCSEHEASFMNRFNQIYSLVQITIVSALPMCLLSVTYFVMVMKILRIDASRRNLKLSQAPGTKKSPCGTCREEVPVAKRRALVMNFIVSSLFLFCWSPIVTLYTMRVIRGHVDRSEDSLYDLLSYIALANLSFNPLVYCFFDSVFRNHVCCCLRYKWKLGRGRNVPAANEPLTEGKLGELSVSKIDSTTLSGACADQEPLLTKSSVQPKTRPLFFSRDKLVRLVCNTRRYRSLGLSRYSEI